MSSGLHDWSVEDRLLVERCQEGDIAAFGQLYERHYPRLVRFVRRRMHERDFIEDLVHEAFAKALAALPELRNPARFYPWLTVIARNLIIHHRKGRGKVSAMAEVDAGHTEGPDAELMRRIELDDLERALQRVHTRHRDVLYMRERQGLSYDDMAAALGTPATTIPPLLFRARQALRREYLAITEEERKLHGLGAGLLLVLHRLRARATRYTVWLPEASTLCASAACVAIGVGALVAGMGGGGAAASADHHSTVVLDGADLPPSTVVATAPPGGFTGGGPPSSQNPGPAVATPESTVIGIAEWSRDRSQYRRNHERAREMPIYQEVGPVWFSADPGAMRRDIESSLRGDTDWMEGGS